MPRKKLKKIQEVDLLPNVFFEKTETDNNWLKNYLPLSDSLIVEIGCGRGDYSIKLAQKYPDKNFIGVDVKGARLWTAAKWALDSQTRNVVFLRACAQELSDYFSQTKIDEIWIPFPDPFPKKRNTKWRVTSPSFLSEYKKVLKNGGRIHVKTDDPAFYEYTLTVLKKLNLPIYISSLDVYNSDLSGAIVEIQTNYEERHLAAGKSIKYVCFGFEDGNTE